MLKDRRRPLTCFLLFILILTIYSVTVYAYEIDESVQVIRVIDGDSFEVSGDEVRLADVSAPEWDEPGGTEATNALSNLISGKTVYLDTDQKSGRGPYGRLIAVVYIIHNSTHHKNVNEALLRLGVVSETDYTNNEFSPSTWALFVRYASTPPPPPPPLPPFISDLTVTPPELELGENVTIGLDVMNPNNQSINYIVTMKIGELTLLVDIELGAYESETVSRTITPDTVGDYNVTVDGITGSFVVVRPPLPAEFVLSELEALPEPGSDIPFETGDFVVLSVLVKNIGETEGTHTVETKVDGETIDTQNVTLAAGRGRHARTYFEALNAGTYQLSVGNLTDTFTVRTPLEPAEFVFSNLQITPRVKIGMSVNISVDVTNVGEEMGFCSFELKLNGRVIESVYLPSFGGVYPDYDQVTATQFFELKRGEGTYEVEVGGLTGSFTVFISEPPFWTSPEFVMGVIAIIICIIAIYVWRLGGFTRA
ncbi:hypothetical protein ES703_54870 [subsurface metagenome]